ncbi:MAG: hypothetical protein JOY85_21120 [Acidobacteriaceae bacterium]|nr:hypothetical protein [Acidobacteriaceae bacterium]
MRKSKPVFDPIEEAYLHAFPNPERIGCPGSEVLRGLATKQLPISHPARTHIARCSPCFQEFRSFQREAALRHRLILSAGLAACFLIALGFLGRSSFFHRNASGPIASITLQKRTADLFEMDPLRGSGETKRPTLPIDLPAAPLKLKVILPRFSRPGPYQIAVCRERNAESAMVKAIGTAVAEGPREVVTVVLDLSGLPKGSYWLSTRHDDNDASDYSAMKLQ